MNTYINKHINFSDELLENTENTKNKLNQTELNQTELNQTELNMLSDEINFIKNMSLNMENNEINAIIELLFKKINSNEYINNDFINIINRKLKEKTMEHNDKIMSWYDTTYKIDLENMKKSIEHFNKTNELYEKSSFIIIKK